MKNIIQYYFWGLLLLGITPLPPTLAQNALPVEDRMLRDSIAENAARNQEQVEYLTLIHHLTRNTRDAVENTWTLQSNYQAFLRSTQSTAALQVADQLATQEVVTQIMASSHHLADYTFAQSLYEVYHTLEEPLKKSQMLYEHLVPYYQKQEYADLTSLIADEDARQKNVLALEEMSARRKTNLAQALRPLAEQKIRQADELQARLNSNHAFSMTQAQRLEMLSRMQQYLSESQKHRTQADELVRQVSRPFTAKQYALERYEKAQQRKVLANTPLFTN